LGRNLSASFSFLPAFGSSPRNRWAKLYDYCPKCQIVNESVFKGSAAVPQQSQTPAGSGKSYGSHSRWADRPDLLRFAPDPSVDADEGGMRTNAPAITAAALIDERSAAATAIMGIKSARDCPLIPAQALDLVGAKSQ